MFFASRSSTAIHCTKSVFCSAPRQVRLRPWRVCVAIGIWWFAVIDTEILCFFREILSFRGHRRYWDTVLFLKILSPDPKRRSWDTEILCFADGERYWDTVILSFARERKIPRYWDTEFRQAEKDTEILRYWASPGWERYWDTDMLSFSKRKIPLSSGKTI